MKYLLGNYCRTIGGKWVRFRTLRDFTYRWWEINTLRLYGGPLSRPERDFWLKTGGYDL